MSEGEASRRCILCDGFKPDSRSGPISVASAGGDLSEVSCPRCGTYLVQRKLLKRYRIEPVDKDVGIRLSGLSRRASDRGEPLTLLDAEYRKVASEVRLLANYSERVDSLLVQLAAMAEYPGLGTSPSLEHLAALVFMPVNATSGLLQQLEGQGLLKLHGIDVKRASITLLPAGWERVDELQRKGPHGARAFVAMWFDDELDPIYEVGIRPALVACGYTAPFRVSDKEHEGRIGEADYQAKIDDRIMAEIRRARFLIVDITGSRQAVYFEAGFAMGLGIPIIWTGRDDSFDSDKTFDTQQFGHIRWKTAEELKGQLVDAINARGWNLLDSE